MADATDPMRPVTVETRGRFRLYAPDGADVTPPGPKARAFLAVLALSPERRRSRIWLQRTLWSDRSDDQARTSLRRLLANLRALPGIGTVLEADRTDIWLTGGVVVDDGPARSKDAVRLDGLELPDAAYMAWLAEARGSPAAATASHPPSRGPCPQPSTPAPLVLIDMPEAGGSPASLFLLSVLGDALAKRLTSQGVAGVHVGRGPPDADGHPGEVVRIEIAAAGHARRPVLHLRAVAGRDRRFLWSGRLAVTEDVETFIERPAMSAFVSAACAGVVARLDATAGRARSPYLRLQMAVARLFSGQAPAIRDAEAALEALRADGGADRGVLLAWTAFARLTRGFEFAAVTDSLREEALALAGEAALVSPTNPLVLALAATLERQFGTDLDRSRFLARAAHRVDEHDPYTIKAFSDLEMANGASDAALRLATQARQAAEGMPNAFYWDMQVCLAALRMGDLPTAQRAARTVHAAQPGYRPALRYLAATALLSGDRTGAAVWATRLADREPGFDLARLKADDYPVATLRLAGLRDKLMV